jgi:microcystin-dependent protein
MKKKGYVCLTQKSNSRNNSLKTVITMDGTMAVITPVAYNFTPKNWAQCNGQLLSISKNQALFSLLGSLFGGDGTSTFALPDLRGSAPVGTGGAYYALGEKWGSPVSTLAMSNIPAHKHNGAINLSLGASTAAGLNASAENNNIGSGIANSFSTNSNTPMAKPLSMQATVGTAGSGKPFNILSPSLVLNFVICLKGVFPRRN